MKARTFMTMAAAALVLAACNNNDDENTHQVTARFSAEIDDAVLTRAAGTQWGQGDEIGISAVNNEAMSGRYTNVKYTTANGDGNFTGTPVYFQNTENVDFTAYYPFSGSEGTAAGTIPNNTRAENQTVTNQKNIDYLFAEAKDANNNNANVSFTFSHKMSQITLTFVNDGDDTDISDITAYTISGLKMVGEFNTANGTATATAENPEELTIGSISDLSGDEAEVAPVILYPQSAADVTLTVALGGQNYSCGLEIEDDELKAGNNYTFDITVSKTGLTVSQYSISGWNPVPGSGTATM